MHNGADRDARAAAAFFATGLALIAVATGAKAVESPIVADMDITELVKVRLSPFDVAAHLDRGYRASNAVSGSRFDAAIRDLPFTIQAFTEAFIEDQKPISLFDVARYSPGVTYRSNDFNEGNANLAIRGFAVSSTPGATQVLRDGFSGPSILDFTNVSRVEVVKGPSSFLYGQVAPGGIVNVITKSPQRRFAASGEAGVGSYGRYRARADVTGPLSDTLSFRVAGSHEQDLHYWKPYDAHSSDLSPSLLWQPGPGVSVSLKYERFRKREAPQVMQKPGYGRQAGLVPTAADPNRQGVDVPVLPDDWNSMADVDYRRSDTEAASAWVDIEASEHWNLRLGHARQRYTIDALFSGNLGMSNNSTLLQGRRLRRQSYANRDETLAADAVGRYRLGVASLRLLVGAQFAKRRFDNQAGQAPNDPALGSDPIGSPLPLWNLGDPTTWNRRVDIPLSALTASAADRGTNARDRSLYAGSTFGFLDDRLLLLAGWRVTDTRSDLEDRIARRSDRITARRTTPQYGVLYRINPELSVYGSYAESFVPGTQVLNRPDGTSAPAEPTQGRGWDAGVKAELLDGRISGTLALFDLRNSRIVNDLAQTGADGAVAISSVQSGEQRSRGVELDATITASPRWQVYASYAYTHARITEFSGNDAAVLAQDPATLDPAGRVNYKNVSLLHGARLQMSAPHVANVWSRYDFTGRGLGGLFVAGGANIVRDQTLLPDGPAASRQSYTLVNAMAGYAWLSGGRRLTVDLTGKNLTAAQYRPSQSTRARPRELLLSVRVDL
jgi:iron complex outermembrane receptor protein